MGELSFEDIALLRSAIYDKIYKFESELSACHYEVRRKELEKFILNYKYLIVKVSKIEALLYDGDRGWL